MANVKITELTALTDPASSDVLPIVDVGEDATKKVTIADLLENAGDGAAATPAFSFDNDKSVGMWRPGSEQLAFSTSGTTRLFIDSSGRCGIGTSSPTVLLDLESTSPIIRLTDSDATGTPECQISGAGGDLILEADRDNEKSDSLIRFLVDGSDAMQINSSGRVGVGESNPDQRLHVKTSSDDVIKLESTSGGNGPNLTFAHTGASPADNDVTAKLTFNATNDASQETTFADIKVITTDVSDGSEDAAFAFSTRNNGTFAERVRITSAGLVGINETSPAGSLHVDADSGVDGPVFDSGGSGNTNHALLVRDSANSQLLRVNNNGNTGIGTTSPRGNLHLHSTSATRFDITNTATGTASTDGSTISIDGSTGALNIIQREAQPINFSTSNAQKAIIDSSGNVGIGATDTLGNKLFIDGGDVRIDGAASTNATLQIRGDNSTGSATDAVLSFVSYLSDISAGSNADITVTNQGSGYGQMVFSTRRGSGANTEALRIDGSGRLLVGTSSARTNFFNGTYTSLFQVEGTAGGTNRATMSLTNNSSANDGAWFTLNKSNGTADGSNTLVSDGNTLGSIGFQGSDGSEFVFGASITAR